jgi:hypothetical protein
MGRLSYRIPLNPTPTDLRALVTGLPAIKQSGKRFYFMLAGVCPNITISSPPRIAQAGLRHVPPAMTNVDAEDDQEVEHDALANCRERSRG